MRSHIEFQSEALLKADAPDRDIHGKSVANLLADQLPQHGYEIIEVAPEDWGWRIQIKNKAFPLWIGCGHFEEYTYGYMCFIEPSKPYVRRLLKRVNTSEVIELLATAIERVLCASALVSNVRWWTDAEASLGKS